MTHWSEFMDPQGSDGAYLPWKKVEPRVGISRTTAWRLQKCGDFPKPYVVSPGRVAYRESEVEAWKASRGHRTANRSAQPRDKMRSSRPPIAAAPHASDAAPSSQAPISQPAASSVDPPRAGPSRRARSRRRGESNQITFEF